MSDLPSSRRLKPNTSQLPVSWYFDPQVFELERSEEHTSELQSQSNLVCRLLLEKKNRLLRSDHKSTRLNCSQSQIAYARFSLQLNYKRGECPHVLIMLECEHYIE